MPAEDEPAPTAAIGRKNLLFVGSSQAGCRAAILASAKANHVGLWAGLCDLLTHLPPGAPVESVLSDTWLTSHPQHRWTIADRRKHKRQTKNYL